MTVISDTSPVNYLAQIQYPGRISYSGGCSRLRRFFCADSLGRGTCREGMSGRVSRSEFRRQAVDCFAFNSHVLQNCRLLHFIRAKSLLRWGWLFGLQAILMGVRNAQWGNVPLLRAEEYRPAKEAA